MIKLSIGCLNGSMMDPVRFGVIGEHVMMESEIQMKCWFLTL